MLKQSSRGIRISYEFLTASSPPVLQVEVQLVHSLWQRETDSHSPYSLSFTVTFPSEREGEN